MVPDDEQHQAQYRSLTDALTKYLEGLAEPTKCSPLGVTYTVYTTAGCIHCHRDDLPIDGSVQPLTDLLLHDIGSGHYPEGDERNEYRTPPLWALSTSGPYLHDGRSETLEDAILQHGGEAEDSRRAYEELSQMQRQKLLRFLNAR